MNQPVLFDVKCRKCGAGHLAATSEEAIGFILTHVKVDHFATPKPKATRVRT